jgi:hypothetical protein
MVGLADPEVFGFTSQILEAAGERQTPFVDGADAMGLRVQYCRIWSIVTLI